MRQDSSRERRTWLLASAIVVVLVVGFATFPAARALVGRFLGSLRMQKVQAVNVDLSAFLDPNANPALHQMVVQMISDKVEVTANDKDQPVAGVSEAAQAAGFPVQLFSARKDSPKLVVAGR